MRSTNCKNCTTSGARNRPVANEYKEQLWERFPRSERKKGQQTPSKYFNSIKEEQKRNLELKTELCVKTEELVAAPLSTRKEWNKALDQLIEIQKVWKTIGFAPEEGQYEKYTNVSATPAINFFRKQAQFLPADQSRDGKQPSPQERHFSGRRSPAREQRVEKR